MHLGRLHHESGVVRFEYDRAWLKTEDAFQLDPELALGAGSFYPESSNFGIFLDSSPDRWGQVLMKRREAVMARKFAGVARTLKTWDFFIGVQDLTRMGALRFSPLQTVKGAIPNQPAFHPDACLADELLAAPAVTELSKLQSIAKGLTDKKNIDDKLVEAWLKVLVAPGASLGGARPKANIRQTDGHLWIAKFAAADDTHDWAAREKLVHQLACDYLLDTSPAELLRIGTGYHTFVTKRFDRVGNRRRFFTSAMSVLRHADREDASYLELAQFISDNGVQDFIKKDLHELFKRLLFNVATGNRDDHLRNHGFIRHIGGWRLAPAFDMNPSIKKDEHVLTLDGSSTEPDLDLAMATADCYQVTKRQAQQYRQELTQVMGKWKDMAKRFRLDSGDVAELQGIFQG